MVESGNSPAEKPESNEEGLQALRNALQKMYPDKNIGGLHSFEVKRGMGHASFTPLMKSLLQVWLNFSIEHPDMTFDEFVTKVQRVADRRAKKRQEMHAQMTEWCENPIPPEQTEKNIAHERQTIRQYLTQLWESFFKGGR